MQIHCLDQGDPPEVDGAVDFDGVCVTYDEAGTRMGCIYTPYALFQSSADLRNYGFWGFTTGSEFPTLDPADAALVDAGGVHAHVSVRPTTIPGVGTQLGLFAKAAIPPATLVGEYAGVVAVDRGDGFDSYGLAYPSVYEDGNMVVSAKEYGNVVRCVNHSFTAFNCRFASVLVQGMLRVVCITVAPIAAGDQLLVNYGASYWKEAGVVPIEWP
ncbi:hypothetical protein ACHHYP_01330 [Achlya hypogyna]|uniref:SET domain-containing protein n=1 Tax=Achlya hypogyna TaxID=1202772 RepID=A0A1V9ZTI7_ACHHY|nr:hypothetical protein ACHHYP_01330 [Achlya hypogyna]